MTGERWVVLGLGHPRAEWFAEVARWSTSAAVPVEFVRCVSADEVRVRLHGGRPCSALLVGDGVVGLDRDLVATAAALGVCTIVVDSTGNRSWEELGAIAVPATGFDRTALMTALRAHAPPISTVRGAPGIEPSPPPASPKGRLVAVTGPGGCGVSTTAMCIAQQFGYSGAGGPVLLADLRLDAELGMLHDAREVMPGVQELTEAHRSGRMAPEQVRSLTFEGVDRGYDLLLGLRHHRDWTAIRPRAFAAAMTGLRAAYGLVVADIDPDLEGEEATGSHDVDDRNTMARHTATTADLVVVVGRPTTKGLHAWARVLRSIRRAGVDADRLVPVCTAAPRRARRRAEVVRALAELVAGEEGRPVANPVFLPERDDLDDAVRDGVRLPTSYGRGLHAEMVRRLHRLEPVDDPIGHDPGVAPQPVAVGSLGHWTEDGR